MTTTNTAATPSFKHLPPESFVTTPWRNGGGVTRQIAIAPAGATVSGAFDWRISSATVGSSGPFSAFNGFDRTLLLLDGQGMDLDFGAAAPATALDGPFKPVAFSGDWNTTGTLRGASCNDFNVFTRRTSFCHDLRVIPSTNTSITVEPADPLVLFAAQGETLVPTWGTLQQGHALMVTGPIPVEVSTTGILLAIRIKSTTQ